RSAPPVLCTLSLHAALPILEKLLLRGRIAEDVVDEAGGFVEVVGGGLAGGHDVQDLPAAGGEVVGDEAAVAAPPHGFGADHRGRSEEHTSELHSRENRVCRV